jgi:hypothetical protein
MGGASLLFGKK